MAKQPEEKLAIVQFTHPGEEALKGEWNTGSHKRKFLRSSGSYVDKAGTLLEGELTFWGEWEPPSGFTTLDNNSDTLYPTRLHEPFIPVKIPVPHFPALCGNARGDACGDSCDRDTCGFPRGRGNGCAASRGPASYQNTDPFVFGKRFRYAICKQSKYYREKNAREITPLARLKQGSLILFGSTKTKAEGGPFFMLDTVFVVASFVPGDKVYSGKEIDKTYRELVIDMACPNKSYPRGQRVYFGADFQNPVEGMYSFAPAQVKKPKDSTGFPRVVLKDLPWITNKLNSAPKITECTTLAQVKEAWNTIVKISQNQHCVEGVQFEMPPQR